MEFSEKTPLIPSNAIPRSEAIFKDEVAAHEKKWIRYRGIILLILGLLFAQFTLFNSWSELLSGGEVDDGWTWSKARPDRELKWHRCYDGVYDCAILDVCYFYCSLFLLWVNGDVENRSLNKAN